MRKRGFTLIELLVVVAIIALLIAILLPSLGKAKANAVRVKCAAVLKQWGIAVTTYAQENNDQFGLMWSYVNPAGTTVKVYWATLSSQSTTMYDTQWSTAANTGMKTSLAFRTCPGDPNFGLYMSAGSAGGTVSGNSNVGARPQIDYAMPRYLPLVSSGPLIWKMGSINHPSTAVLLADSPPSLGAAGSTTNGAHCFSTMGDISGTAGSEQLSESLLKRHGGTGNALFIDSHVEAEKLADYNNNIPTNLSGLNIAPAEAYKVWSSFQTP